MLNCPLVIFIMTITKQLWVRTVFKHTQNLHIIAILLELSEYKQTFQLKLGWTLIWLIPTPFSRWSRTFFLPGYGTLPFVTSSVSRIPKDHTSDFIVNLPYSAASGAVHLMGNFAPKERIHEFNQHRDRTKAPGHKGLVFCLPHMEVETATDKCWPTIEYSQRGQVSRTCRESRKTKQGRDRFVPYPKRRIRHLNSSLKFYKMKKKPKKLAQLKKYNINNFSQSVLSICKSNTVGTYKQNWDILDMYLPVRLLNTEQNTKKQIG